MKSATALAQGMVEVFGIPLLLAIVIVVVGLFLIRAAFSLVKVLLVVAVAVAAWFLFRMLFG